jgi:hypothetical protein
MANRTVNEHEARMYVIFQAARQTEKILQVLKTAATAAVKGESGGFEHLILGLAPRLEQLNSIIMSGADDEMETAQSLRIRMNS